MNKNNNKTQAHTNRNKDVACETRILLLASCFLHKQNKHVQHEPQQQNTTNKHTNKQNKQTTTIIKNIQLFFLQKRCGIRNITYLCVFRCWRFVLTTTKKATHTQKTHTQHQTHQENKRDKHNAKHNTQKTQLRLQKFCDIQIILCLCVLLAFWL